MHKLSLAIAACAAFLAADTANAGCLFGGLRTRIAARRAFRAERRAERHAGACGGYSYHEYGYAAGGCGAQGGCGSAGGCGQVQAGGWCGTPSPQAVPMPMPQAPPKVVPVLAPPPPPLTYSGGVDPYGFVAVLNRIRARHGLRALSYDSGLAAYAAQNNLQQRSRGLGHHVVVAAQCAAVNGPSAEAVGAQWYNSPAHRAIMLTPSASVAGVAWNDGFWTLNVR